MAATEQTTSALASRQLETVQHLSSLVLTPLDRESLLEQVLETIMAAVDVEAGSLVFVDPDTEELRFEVVRGPLADSIREIVLQPGEGVIGWAIQNRRSALVPRAETDERFAPRVDQLVGFETHSLAVCPMVLEDHVVGAIELVNKRDGEQFDEADRHLLEIAATAAALVVEHYRLKAWARRKVDESETLVEVERVLNSTLDASEMLRNIVESAVQVGGGQAGSLLLVDPEVGDLYFEVATGEKADEVKAFRVPMGRGIAGWVAQNREPLLVFSVREDPRFDPMISESLEYGTESIVAVPMILRDEVIGVIEVLNLPRRIADPGEYVNIMTGLASQAASALDRARLYGELCERVESTEDELRTALRQLSTAKRRTDAMIESLADGIVVVDPNRRVVLVNPAAERLLGVGSLPPEHQFTLAELPHSEFLLPVFDEAVRHPLEAAHGEGTFGEVAAKISATQVLDEEGRPLGTVGILTDVTHFQELNRLKTELIGIVSHELRSPLTSLKAAAGMMLRDRELPEETEREFLEIMADQCDRMNRMIGTLLNASRVEVSGHLDMVWEQVDLVELLDKTAEQMRLPAADHEFLVDLPEGPLTSWVDADKFQQIVTNLLDNALKYSPPGSEIRLTLAATDQGFQLTVADQGAGIPESEIPKLFELFERTEGGQRQTAKGTGVGLYLVKHLVEAHHGSISVTSEVDKGSTFTVCLPRLTEPPAEAK